MVMYRDDIVIDTRFGDLDGDLSPEKVTLIGVQDESYSSYMTSLKIIIEKDNTKKYFSISLEGYNFKLALANFLKSKEDQILITGQYGGSGGYAIFNILQYKNNKLKLLLNNEKLNNKLKSTAKYLDNYKVAINCENSKSNFIIDVSKTFKGYLDLVYKNDGTVYEGTSPTISEINTIYPILESFKDHYSLQLQQRIIGVSNSDLIGAIQTIIDFDESSNITVGNQCLLLFDRSRDM